MVKKQEIVVQTQSRLTSSPSEMIRLAVSGGADLDKLEKLLAIQERWEATEARKEYHQAMSDFKATPPKIEKDKKVGYDGKTGGRVSYSHASLANVTDKINEALSKHGLSASWRTKQNGKIEVTCRITHSKGHSEETMLSADADTSGSKNSIQALGSTITYLERYTLLALTGLATFDMDDDGKGKNSEDVEKIGDKELHSLRDQFIALDVKEGKFISYMGIEKLEDMPLSDYPKANAALEAIRTAKKDKVAK